MKISVTKKLLIICLSLVLAAAAAVFAVLQINRNAYAEVAPDGVTAYADGDEGEGGETTPPATTNPSKPGEGNIADPIAPDKNPDDPEWVLTYQEIIFQVGKLEIQVAAWPSAPQFDSEPTYNTNPNGTYSDDLVKKIKELLASNGFIERTVLDIDGNEITDADMVQAGHTYFIHVKVCEKYADSVTITYADGVQSSCAFTAPFPPGTVLQPIPMLDPITFEFEYDGTTIDLRAKVLDLLLKDKDHILQFVASESDSLTQNGAGVFHLRICFKDGAKYCWDTDIKDDRSAIDIVVTITPMKLDVVTEITKEIYYTGFEIDIIEELKAIYGDYVIVAYGYTTKQTAAGTYEFNIRINPDYEGSVTWADGHEGVVTVKWIIKVSTIHGDWGPEGDYGRIKITSETYKGGTAGAIEYIYYNVDEDREIDLTVEKLVVGTTYSIKAVLVNGSLVWDVDPGEHIFTLTKELIVVEYPVFKADKIEYTGGEITFELLIDGKPITHPDNADKVEIVIDMSDSLTQSTVGKYKVVIRLKDEAYSWPGNVTGDIEIYFEITLVIIDVEWTMPVPGGIPVPSFITNYNSEDFSSIIKITYYNSFGVEVKRCDLVKGTYTAVLTLIDEENFQWQTGAIRTKEFILTIDLIELEIPVLSGDVFDYTGDDITVTANIWEQIKDYVMIVSGSFVERDAGEHTIILKITDSTRYWKGGANEYLKLTFTINRAVLIGDWGSDGRIKFTSSFTGNYDDVVEYIYRDSNGNIVSYADLKDGETYTASVRLKAGMDKNFDGSNLPLDHTFTFKIPSNKSSFPWWIFLIIAAVIIIIVIIIIIIIMKKRKKDDDYDDFYGDEYYGDEENGGGEDEEFNPDGYEDYGGEADYGADAY